MVDNAQKGAYARSVAGLAAQLALTDWLVDIRHEATHTQLPGLPVLRLAAAEVCSPQASNTNPKICPVSNMRTGSFSDA
jgi:ribosomal biogenesis protein LAS1